MVKGVMVEPSMHRELVERAMHGDRDAFGMLAVRAFATMTGTAGLILQDRDVADDAVQEALVRAWRDLPGLRDPDRFEGWLTRILVRSCQDQLRRRRRERTRSSEDSAAGPQALADPAAGLAVRDELESALATLPVDQRTVVVLHYYLGMTYRQVADAIDQPIGTVKSRLSRALDRLQAELAAADRRGRVKERDS